MGSLLARSRLIRRRLKTRPTLPRDTVADLRNNASHVSRLIKLRSTQESLASKKRLHALLRQGGARSQRLFWSLINLLPRAPPVIEALSSSGTLTVILAELKSITEDFISVKFNTSFSPDDITWKPVGDATLDPPVRTLSPDASDNLVRPFTMAELASTLSTLDCSKSEGLDKVTNAMLRNTGQVAREMLLTMFNNVLVGGQSPDSWKEGDLVLILKKPPRTDISNYRPITLISCVSKVLTKMLARRLSDAVETDDLIGPEQNGFRANRSCSDNLFVLNTILEINRSKKLLTHLLFVDLKEAYDRVDRGVLLQKLKDMNFPAPFLRYLTDYYFLDNISTAIPGVRTRKQYQNRGLRQGCNLSSVLFVLYVSDLPTHLLAQGVGVRLPSGELVCVLLFADDIVLIAISLPDLDILKTSLE